MKSADSMKGYKPFRLQSLRVQRSQNPAWISAQLYKLDFCPFWERPRREIKGKWVKRRTQKKKRERKCGKIFDQGINGQKPELGIGKREYRGGGIRKRDKEVFVLGWVGTCDRSSSSTPNSDACLSKSCLQPLIWVSTDKIHNIILFQIMLFIYAYK